MIYQINQINEIADELINGRIGVLPTDTIYGIHALATNSEAIERIYTIKGRDKDKPFLTLINSIETLNTFCINVTPEMSQIFDEKWPGPVSIVFKCENDGFGYLHRGQFSLGFRFPNNQFLNKLLEITGPIVSTSANISGTSAVKDITQAQQVLGDLVDFYVDGGQLIGSPSTVLKFENNELTKLR